MSEAKPWSRAAWGAVAILVLAMVAGDVRVLMVGVPLAIAFGLSMLADRA